MAEPMYFHLVNEAHHKCVMAGDRHDGHVYHQELESNGGPRYNARWTFEKVSGTGYDAIYYIRDQKHGRYLVAGDEYDGTVYHLHHEDRRNAQWMLEKVDSQPECFYIRDMKHGRYLVAGDDDDGHIYHQPHSDRLNARWKFEFANEDKTGFDRRGGPAFLVVDEEVQSVHFTKGGPELRPLVAPRPPIVLRAEWLPADTGPQIFEATKLVPFEWTMSFQPSVTKVLAKSILARFWDEGLPEEHEFSLDGSALTASGLMKWTIKVEDDFDSTGRVVADVHLVYERRTLFFEATVVRTTADGDVWPAEKVNGRFEHDKLRVEDSSVEQLDTPS
ncbi:MAG: hypothetical protein R3F60_28110 [bacterium]